MRFGLPLAILAALALLAGCGGSDEETTGVPASQAPAREARAAFIAEPSCRRPAGASRWGCSIPSYRCQAVVVDRGWSVSCSRPGDSVAFIVPR